MLEGVDAPFEFVSVTATPMQGNVVPGGPVNVNGTVIVNWLPKAVDVELLYQVVKGAVSGKVKSVVVNGPLVVGVK